MRKIIFFVLLAAIVTPVFAFAAAINMNLDYPEFGNITLNKAECERIEADIKAGIDPGKICGQNLNIVAWMYYFIVGIAGLAAFVMIVWGGIQWLTSGAIPSQASEARDKLRAAVLGLLLILSSFLIIQVINPQLTILNQPGLDEFFGTNPSINLQGPPPANAGGTPILTITPSVVTLGTPATVAWLLPSGATVCDQNLTPDPGGVVWGPTGGILGNFDPTTVPNSGSDPVNILTLGTYTFILGCSPTTPVTADLTVTSVVATDPPTVTFSSLSGGVDTAEICTTPDTFIHIRGGNLDIQFTQTDAQNCSSLTGLEYFNLSPYISNPPSDPVNISVPGGALESALYPFADDYWFKLGISCTNTLGTDQAEITVLKDKFDLPGCRCQSSYPTCNANFIPSVCSPSC